MKHFGSASVLLLSSCFVAAVGCGSSTPRTLTSVTVSPSAADAQNYPNGQVQFVATGNFNKAPTHVTPYQVSSWLTRNPAVATIDQNGLSTCVAGQSGTVTISIALPGDGTLKDVATLTCP